MIETADELLKKYDVPGPRYTSYPTILHWDATPSPEEWFESVSRGLDEIEREGSGAAVYVHIPFCRSLCTYCGCNSRITEPSIECALRRLKEWGAQRLVVLPLFPQFSTTTTGTCLEEARDALGRLRWSPLTHEIKNWPDHADYARLLRRTVDEAIWQAERDRGESDEVIHVLFSAHSLPLKIVERGDPYAQDVRRTVGAVAEGLGHPWSLCFQSRNGRMPWLQPYTEDELSRLGREGVRRIVVVPVSFVSDHIETLYELDLLYREHALKHGVTHYYRARAFNGDPAFPAVLRSILKEANVCSARSTRRGARPRSSAVDYLLTPFVSGVYGALPAELGVEAAFPSLSVAPGRTLLGTMLGRAFGRPAGSRPHATNGHTSGGAQRRRKERKRMVAPRFGMGDRTERLERRLEERLGGRFKKGVAVREVPDAPNVIISTPAYAAASLLETSEPELAGALRGVSYTPVVSVTAFVRTEALSHPVNGVGVLAPAKEGRQCLGVLFISSSFGGRVSDETSYASFAVLLGGSSHPEWIDATDEEIEEAVRGELAALLGVCGEPVELVINRWTRAIPRYSVTLPAVWRKARETWCAEPGRVLFGNYTGQVSLRGMIESAARAG